MTHEGALADAWPVVLDPPQYKRGVNFVAYAGSQPRRKSRPVSPISRDERLDHCPAASYFDGEPSVVSIIAIVAAFYGLCSADVTLPCRRRPIVRPRHVAMYLAMALTSFGRPRLGWIFKRDRQTIYHGFANVTRLLGIDPELAADVAALRGHILVGQPS